MHTDKQSAFGPVPQDYRDGAKRQSNLASEVPVNATGSTKYQILGIAKPTYYQKENKYELIACGDYNSYAIVNI